MGIRSVIEIESTQPERTRAFWREHEREGLSALYDFRVVWHEQSYELAATSEGEIVGVLRLRIAASLARPEMLIVAPARRRKGIGRALLTHAEDLAKYYNCHKITLEVPVDGAAQAFLTACGYKAEAILPQHTFKLDCAVMRKFVL
jgi:ribosomal protein S18 acetylase RimI-like enzyme